MRKIIIVCIAVLLLVTFVSAEEINDTHKEMFGAEELEEGLPNCAKDLVGDLNVDEQTDPVSEFLSIMKKALAQSVGGLPAAVGSACRVLIIVVLCQVVASVTDGSSARIAAITGTLAIAVSCVSNVNTMIGLGKTTIQELSDFSKLLMPVMASATAASGSVTKAAVIYSLATAVSSVLVHVSTKVIVPLIYAYLGIAVADSALGQERLKPIKDFLGWVAEKSMKMIVYVFTGFLSISGVLAGAADAAALKAAKATLSTAVPVVGGIISGAAETVLSSATFLKNTIGTFGMIGLIAVFIVPFFDMGISFLMFKLVSVVGGVIESGQSMLLRSISTAMGYLLAMVGSCALMCLLSCCCFLKYLHT